MNKILLLLFSIILLTSCIKQINLYVEKEEDSFDKDDIQINKAIYNYPFKDEVKDISSEIIIKTKAPIRDINSFKVNIPHLKYNKSWLLLLTQDDCKHSALCRTWAAINGKPISTSQQYPTPSHDNPNITRELYYDILQLINNDLPPNVINSNQTLGCTDGAGNEVRFTFTTTLAAEEAWMNSTANINPGFTGHYSRFYLKNGLSWYDVKELLNYDNSIAFHDLKASNVYDQSLLIDHYALAQSIILEKLNGRGCKMLAEPNGNKTYIEAAINIPEIQTMTSQGNYSNTLYPFQVNDNLEKNIFTRFFNDSPDYFKSLIESNNRNTKEDRQAICIGIHNTDDNWTGFLKWVNDTYGKDGDDSVWFTSQDEYYEYNYYRTVGNTPQLELIDEYTFKIKINLPSQPYFYYPSITINLTGVINEEIESIETTNSITGFSYADYEDGLMLNIDCRKYIAERAEYFVGLYEKDKSNKSTKRDALYFVSKLKNSEQKQLLIERIK